jgi:hypothetical protein
VSLPLTKVTHPETREDPMLKRLTLPTLVLAGVLAFLAAPDQTLRASACGEKGDYLCEETETCNVFLWFFKYGCSSEFKYWTDGPTELEEVA